MLFYTYSKFSCQTKSSSATLVIVCFGKGILLVIDYISLDFASIENKNDILAYCSLSIIYSGILFFVLVRLADGGHVGIIIFLVDLLEVKKFLVCRNS